jgi:LysR family glycine cleavage system transcriptional activator
MLPPLNSLRCFESVARLRSFTDAADELSVTTSAVSHQVKSLEEYFQLKLTEKHGRGFELTLEGEALKEDLGLAFKYLKRAVANLRSLPKNRPLGISTPTYFATKWLAQRLHRFWEIPPKYELRFIHTRDSDDSVDFTDHNINIAIQWDSEINRDENETLLVRCQLTPACSPELLESLPGFNSPKDLQSFSCLHGENQDAWKAWLELAGVPNIVSRYYEYYEDEIVRINAATQGEGFCLVCRELSYDEIASGNLVCPFDVTLDTFGYYLDAPSGREHNEYVSHFIKWLKTEAALP